MSTVIMLHLEGLGTRRQVPPEDGSRRRHQAGPLRSRAEVYLAEHSFTSWQVDTRQALAPVATPAPVATAPSSLNDVIGHVGGHADAEYGRGTSIETLKQDIDWLEFYNVPWNKVVTRIDFFELSNDPQVTDS